MKTQAKKPTHEDWEAARARRDSAARLSVRALLAGRTDEARQQALKYDEQDDIMWSISKMLDGPCAVGDLG
jgi:hypothetical protein